MSFDFDKFAKKADEANTTRQQAIKDGRKMGTLQDHGIFLGPNAPAHLKNKLYPMASPEEIQARWDSREHDSLYQKLGPGATVSTIYRSPELRAKLTPAEIEELWRRYFAAHPHEDKTPWAYPEMIAEANALRTNRRLIAKLK